MEVGESFEQTAIREVFEETGMSTFKHNAVTYYRDCTIKARCASVFNI